MGFTLTSDLSVLKPEIYGPQTQTKIAQFIDFMMQGMCDRVGLPAGEFVPFPGWKQLAGELDVMVDGGTYDINKIDPLKDISVVLHRIKAFGADDLAQIITGRDPNAEISKQLAVYFSKKIMATMMTVLKGVFASGGPLETSNAYDVFVDSATPASQKLMIPAVAATGLAKIGDELRKIAGWVMHSKVYADLLAAGYISTSVHNDPYGIDAGGELLKFMGKPLLVADNVTTIAGTTAGVTKYLTYGVGTGALAYGIQKDVNPEQDRDMLNKKNFVSTDVHFSAHVRGCAYVTATGANPTDTLLATGSSWTLSAELSKFVPIVRIATN